MNYDSSTIADRLTINIEWKTIFSDIMTIKEQNKNYNNIKLRNQLPI